MPDTLSAIYEYDGGFHINYSCYFGNERYGYGEQICGNDGTIEVMNRQDLYFTPEAFKGKPPASVKARQPIHINGKNDFKEADGAIRVAQELAQKKAEDARSLRETSRLNAEWPSKRCARN